MTEMYGHKFTSSYGDEPNDTWSRALRNVTGQQVANALRECFQREDTWPPTLTEFVDMCRDKPSSLYFPDGQKSLPHTFVRSTREKATSEINNIRKELKK